MDDTHTILDDVEEMQNEKVSEKTDSNKRNSEQLKGAHQIFRRMEANRRRYHNETEGKMRQQQALLHNINSDNHAIQDLVDTYAIKDYEEQMTQLTEEAMKYTSMVEIESNKIKDLDYAIAQLSHKELESKRATGGYNAGWTNHLMTQIHIQQRENRLQKANIKYNIVQGQNKTLKNRMVQLQQEQGFYRNLYEKMNKEFEGKKRQAQKCFHNMKLMYEERNEFREAMSDLYEMEENKHNYAQWLATKGWLTQDPVPLTQSFKYLHETSGSNLKVESVQKNQGLDAIISSKTLAKSKHISRRKAKDSYGQWIEIKAFANIQDVLNIGTVNNVFPALIDMQKESVEVFNAVIQLVMEMDQLDVRMQENMLSLSGFNNAGSVPSLSRKHETSLTIESIVETLKHLEVDDVIFLPLIKDIKKQISSIFGQAGFQITDQELGVDHLKPGAPIEDNAPLELTTAKLFQKLENFVDGISGTLS